MYKMPIMKTKKCLFCEFEILENQKTVKLSVGEIHRICWKITDYKSRLKFLKNLKTYETPRRPN